MLTDPVVEQLHKQREEYMERFQYDFDAIIRDIRAHERPPTAPLVKPRRRSRPTVWRGGLASAALEQAWVGARVVVWR